jgi:WD40 repeat protein
MMWLAVIAVAAIAWQWRVASAANNRAERELHRNRLALADRDITADAVLSGRRWLLEVVEAKRGWEWESLWQSSYVTPGNRLPEQPSPLVVAHVLSEQGQLATLQYDGAVQLWDLKTLRLLHQWSAWEKPKEYFASLCHAFSKDGRVLAVSCAEKDGPQASRSPVIKVMHLQSGEVLFAKEHRARALALDANGSVLYALVSASSHPEERELVVAWNLASGERLFEFERPIDPGYSTDGERLAVTSDGEKLYDLGGRRAYSAHDGKAIEETSFSPSESNRMYQSPLAMSADDRLGAWAREWPSGALQLQDVKTGQSREIITEFDVKCAAFSKDGRVIAAVVQDVNFDLAEVKLNEALPVFGPMMSLSQKSRPYLYHVYIYDVRNGRLIRSLRGFPGYIFGLAFCNNDQQLVAVGGEFASETLKISKAHGDALLWDIAESGSGRLLAKLDESVCNISISADSTLLAAGCRDGTAYVWNLNTGEQMHALTRRSDEEPVFAVFGPNNKMLAVSGERKLSLFDAVSGEEKWSAEPDSGDFGRVTWTPDGRLVAAATAEETIFLYAASGEFDHNVFDRGPVVYSQDGRYTAWPQMHDLHGELIVVDAKSGSEVFRAKTEMAPAVFSTGYGFMDAAFSPDGKVVVAVGNNGPGLAFYTSSGRPLYKLQGRDGTFWSVDFSPDGTRIATGGRDGAIRIWDATTGDELHAFHEHDQAVIDLAFSPDGAKLVSGGQDGRIKIWETSR